MAARHLGLFLVLPFDGHVYRAQSADVSAGAGM